MNDLYKTGLGLIWVEMLYDAGYRCLDDLAMATDEELLAIPGMGPFKVRAIRNVAPFVPLTTGPHAVQFPLEEADDLRSLPDQAASGGQHPDG